MLPFLIGYGVPILGIVLGLHYSMERTKKENTLSGELF